MEGMEIDRTGKWEGQLPDDCQLVHVQWFDGEVWSPAGPKPTAAKEKAIQLLEEAIRSAKFLRYEKYRLISAGKVISKALVKYPKEDIMSKKKQVKKVKKTAKVAPVKRTAPPVEPQEAVEYVSGNPFRPGSGTFKVYEFMKDGQPHTVEEIAEKTGVSPKWIPDSNLYAIRKLGAKDGAFTVVHDKEKRYQLIPA